MKDVVNETIRLLKESYNQPKERSLVSEIKDFYTEYDPYDEYGDNYCRTTKAVEKILNNKEDKEELIYNLTELVKDLDDKELINKAKSILNKLKLNESNLLEDNKGKDLNIDKDSFLSKLNKFVTDNYTLNKELYDSFGDIEMTHNTDKRNAIYLYRNDDDKISVSIAEGIPNRYYVDSEEEAIKVINDSILAHYLSQILSFYDNYTGRDYNQLQVKELLNSSKGRKTIIDSLKRIADNVSREDIKSNIDKFLSVL